MYWENPSILLGLWILPLVAWGLVRAHRKRRTAARRFVDPAMVQRLMPALSGPRPWIKGILLLAGLGLLIVAAARPRFGVYTETVRQHGVDLFVLLDVSRSMTAEDVAPSRLERAKSDIRDLLPHLVGDRVGLIVFAGKPVVKIPLTNDQGFFRMTLDEVDVHSAPRGGTLIGDAIRKSMEAMPRSRDRDQVLVLITDGEDQDSFAEDAAKQAAERGMKIFSVGLGDSREGSRIPVRDDAGQLSFVQDAGQEKWSKLNDSLLQQIALTTGGAYIPAGTQAYDLGQVYADHLAGLTRGAYQAEKRKRYREQFQLFLCLGLALLMVEMGIAHCRNGRQRGETPNAETDDDFSSTKMASSRFPAKAPVKSSAKSPGRSASTRLLLATVVLAIPSLAEAAPREAVKKVDQGIASYRAGDYKQAAASFDEAAEAAADDLWIAFDRGMALAAQGESDKAVEFLQKASLSPDFELAVRSRYNLGCLAAAKAKKRFGEHPENATPEVRKEGLADLVLAVSHFRDCIHLDKEHADARHNLELIRVWVKQMESLWEQMDRKKQRDELDLPAFLQMLEEKQRALRVAARALAEMKGTPQRREAQRAAETAQRKLGEEIGPLKEKIEATLAQASQAGAGGAPGGSGTPAPAPMSEEIKKAIAHLDSLADEAARSIDAAAQQLRTDEPSAAVKPQTETVEKFNELYRCVVPYPSLVGRAVASQKGLVDENTPSAAAEEPAKKAADGDAVPPEDSQAKKGAGSEPTDANAAENVGREATVPLLQRDAEESAWNQEFVTRYAEILTPLAKAGLKQLSAMEASPPAAGSAPANPNAGADPNASDKDAAQKAEELKQQREAIKRSMEKAVEAAPVVEKLSSEAAGLLRERKPEEALPKQQEALKLLEEIAKLLPKQKPEDQKKDQDKQDQQKQDQDKQDQKDKDQEKKDQEKKDQQKQDQDKKDQKKQDEKQQEKPKPKDASQQQAEAALRQVQDRQQQRQEKEKALQRYLTRPGNVEKDW